MFRQKKNVFFEDLQAHCIHLMDSKEEVYDHDKYNDIDDENFPRRLRLILLLLNYFDTIPDNLRDSRK